MNYDRIGRTKKNRVWVVHWTTEQMHDEKEEHDENLYGTNGGADRLYLPECLSEIFS